MVEQQILLVDDHEVVRAGLKNIISSQEGWSVCAEACNGMEAVEKAIELKPDLVIMDITMPVMSGLAAAAKIRDLIPATKILVLTMHDVVEPVRALLNGRDVQPKARHIDKAATSAHRR